MANSIHGEPIIVPVVTWVDARSVVAIEDSAIGLQAAKAAGLYTIATPNTWTESQDFSAADLLLGSLADPEQPLAAADQDRIGAKYLGLEQLLRLHAAAAAATRA